MRHAWLASLPLLAVVCACSAKPEDADWTTARQSPAGIEEHLRRFPQTRHRGDAEAALFDGCAAGTIASCRAYLETFPSAAPARAVALDQHFAEACTNGKDASACAAYLDALPSAAHVNDVEAVIWQRCTNAPSSCAFYAARFPNGAHIADLEARAWKACADDIHGCRSYLDMFPDGANRSGAARRVIDADTHAPIRTTIFVVDSFDRRPHPEWWPTARPGISHGTIVDRIVKLKYPGPVVDVDLDVNGLGVTEPLKLLAALRQVAQHMRMFPSTPAVVLLGWGAIARPDPLVESAVADLRALNATIVAAAGNDSRSTCAYPAAYDGIIGISSATKSVRALARNPTSNSGGCVQAAALDDPVATWRTIDASGTEEDAADSGFAQAAANVSTSFGAARAAATIAAYIDKNPATKRDAAILVKSATATEYVEETGQIAVFR